MDFVSTHSRLKAAGSPYPTAKHCLMRFNTQPPEGGWTGIACRCRPDFWFQHTAARRRLASVNLNRSVPPQVSTHSRPKAAGCLVVFDSVHFRSFNTQPPEGGWGPARIEYRTSHCFNTQSPEGGWGSGILLCFCSDVSTHSRPKAAGPPAISQNIG